METSLEQPWKLYLHELSQVPKAPRDNNLPSVNNLGDTESALNPEKLCPGSPECSLEPHPLGSTPTCAFESNIGIIFMNSTG